jgi:hypothetical protein
MTKGNKVAVGCVGVPVLLFAIAWFSPAGDAVRDILKTGVLEDKPIDAKYEGDSKARLKALHTAAIAFHQSEEMFPDEDEWMADLLKFMKTSDLKEGEAERKLIRPDLEGQKGKYGYAMNKAVAAKYKNDLKDPKVVMFFECKNPVEQAVGDPAADAIPKANAITLDGTLIMLP